MTKPLDAVPAGDTGVPATEGSMNATLEQRAMTQRIAQRVAEVAVELDERQAQNAAHLARIMRGAR